VLRVRDCLEWGDTETAVGRTCIDSGSEIVFWCTFDSVGSPYRRLEWEKHLPADSVTYPLSPASGGGVQGTSLVRTSFDGRWTRLLPDSRPNRNVMPAPGLQSGVLRIGRILCLLSVRVHSRVGWGTVLPVGTAVAQLVKKLPTFYRVPRFITVLTTASTCPYPESG
jgi:hypothetical protein